MQLKALGIAAVLALTGAVPAHAGGFHFGLGLNFVLPPIGYVAPYYAPYYAAPNYLPPTFVPPTTVYGYPPPYQHPDETTRWVQQSLNFLMGAGLNVDGIVGPATIYAISAFQSLNGMYVDGIAGTGTIAVIEHQLRQRMPPPSPPLPPAPPPAAAAPPPPPAPPVKQS